MNFGATCKCNLCEIHPVPAVLLSVSVDLAGKVVEIFFVVVPCCLYATVYRDCDDCFSYDSKLQR